MREWSWEEQISWVISQKRRSRVNRTRRKKRVDGFSNMDKDRRCKHPGYRTRSCTAQGRRMQGCQCKGEERNRLIPRGHRTRGHRAQGVCTRVRTARMQASYQQSHQVQTLAKMSLFRGAKERRCVSNAYVSKVSPITLEWQREPGIKPRLDN